MILGFHCIISAYGFWLPNEPRGSWSDFVRSLGLYPFGPATKVTTHRSVAHRPYDRDLKHQMQRVLKYAPVRFTGEPRARDRHELSTRSLSHSRPRGDAPSRPHRPRPDRS